jgi:hypothetical protein
MLTSNRILRATVLSGLAIVVLTTHVFVDIDRIRVKVLPAPAAATAGQVRATTAGLPEANALRPPFALIARINSPAPGANPFSVTVDRTPVCMRDVAGSGSRRIDCAVAGEWNPAIEHQVAIQGPSTEWTLEYLELATHHGNTDGAHYLMVLPASSGHYVRPAIRWVIAAWLILIVLLLLPTPPPLPRWIRLLYRIVAVAVVLELTVSLFSQWISDYRIVLSAGTFTRLLILLFAPRLWAAGRLLVQTGATSLQREALAPWRDWVIAALVLCVGAVTAWQLYLMGQGGEGIRRRLHIAQGRIQVRTPSEQARDNLFAELQPIRLKNCEFERFGEAHDGGYLLCANLLASVQSGYSYGISGYDQWGCDVSRRLAVPVHEYDCFNLQVPVCPTGLTVFHGECIGAEAATIEGRPFDALENQFARNGDGAKRLVVKMDVEGAEWDSLLRTPDAVLERIDQLTIEMHGVREEERFTAVVLKLKQFFYVANVHFNNFACQEGIEPFPAEVYEVLFVSKRLGVPGGSGRVGAPAALAASNNPAWSDCQSLADLPPLRPPGR